MKSIFCIWNLFNRAQEVEPALFANYGTYPRHCLNVVTPPFLCQPVGSASTPRDLTQLSSNGGRFSPNNLVPVDQISNLHITSSPLFTGSASTSRDLTQLSSNGGRFSPNNLVPVDQIPFSIGANENNPYACQFCDKAFSRLSYLKRHEQVSLTLGQVLSWLISRSGAQNQELLEFWRNIALNQSSLQRDNDISF